jgi:asparagine synthase (glutamine-hydrolysing)
MRKQGIKLVFSGHGGDEGISRRSNPYELFYYHEYYRYLRLMFSRSSISKHRVVSTIKNIYENQKQAKNEFLRPFNADHKELCIISSAFSQKNKYTKKRRFTFPYDPKQYVIDGGSRNRLDVLAFFSAATGVRYLVPYLDYRVLDFALGIPRYLYHNWYTNRYIFREAFKDLMPDSLYRVKLKRDTSYTNLHKKDEDDQKKQNPDQIKRIKKKYLDLLDEEYWSEYLDFDKISNWVNGTTPEDEDGKIMECLGAFIQAQYLVKRSREVNK